MLLFGTLGKEWIMKRLGVIGGLGPMATAYFLQLLTQMNDAKHDQEHIETFIYSKPSIPDRTRYILGQSEENPVPEIVSAGKLLKAAGAEMLAIPCITAHFFHAELEKEIGLPIINAIRETVLYLKERNIGRVGILATDGTIQSRLFQKAFEEEKIQSIIPDENEQKEIMNIIYKDVKAGQAINRENFFRVSQQLFERRAQVIILACTELSIVKRDFSLPAGYLDVMEVLSMNAVKHCGNLREEYQELFT